LEESQTFIPITEWLFNISNAGMIVFLMGALVQYVLLRFKAMISIPQTFPILIISRIISIILAWSISFFIPENKMIVALFVFVPAVISEILLLAFSYIVLAQMGKKESTED
jgi:hypothetical protein